MTISKQAAKQIDQEVDETANDWFDNVAFAQQDFIHHEHWHMLHAGTDAGHQFHTESA